MQVRLTLFFGNINININVHNNKTWLNIIFKNTLTCYLVHVYTTLLLQNQAKGLMGGVAEVTRF